MSKVNQIDIRCSKCSRWFPSPIIFGDSESFDTSTMYGNLAQCPYCGKMTSCNKENMRVRHEKGGFIGDETV